MNDQSPQQPPPPPVGRYAPAPDVDTMLKQLGKENTLRIMEGNRRPFEILIFVFLIATVTMALVISGLATMGLLP